MGNDGFSIIGDWGKPADTLITKLSDGLGGLLKPWQIRRVAKADADALKTKALAGIEVTEIQARAIKRVITEETKRQQNIESIAGKAIGFLSEDSRPQDIDDDWISTFLAECKLVSDEEMQTLWAKILAGEANTPGSYSKRTVKFVSMLDKSEANKFTILCSFILCLGKYYYPIIYNTDEDILELSGLSFDIIKHLHEIGLINFLNIGYMAPLEKNTACSYFDKKFKILSIINKSIRLKTGTVSLTKIGYTLQSIAGATPNYEYYEYIKKQLIKRNNYKIRISDIDG